MQSVIWAPVPGEAIDIERERKRERWDRQNRIIAGKGITLSRTMNGTVINATAQSVQQRAASAAIKPFTVRWYKQDEDRGQWQIYLPYGSAILTQKGEQASLTQPYAFKLAPAEDKEGNEIPDWYAFEPEPGIGGDAKIVYAHFLPWPWFEISTEGDTEKLEIGCSWQTLAIAVIQDKNKEKRVMRQIRAGEVEFVRDIASAWSLRYDVAGDHGKPDVKVFVVNQKMMAGRAQIFVSEPTEVTNAETVWVKIDHPGTDFKVSIEKDLSDDAIQSDDDKTVFQLYGLKKNVVTTDCREDMPVLDFYTNEPDAPESTGGDDAGR